MAFAVCFSFLFFISTFKSFDRDHEGCLANNKTSTNHLLKLLSDEKQRNKSFLETVQRQAELSLDYHRAVIDIQTSKYKAI
ncbi:hypothetical protein C8J56DRAFT_911921 [Mycena floridula]|nr:hypothetical protein C8J56DRAFT_911921 [Mycena floridula]